MNERCHNAAVELSLFQLLIAELHMPEPKESAGECADMAVRKLINISKLLHVDKTLVKFFLRINIGVGIEKNHLIAVG